MSDKKINQMIGKVFSDIAEAIETGNFGSRPRIGLTILGSEHGTEELLKGAMLATSRSSEYEVVLIGPKVCHSIKTYEANSEDEAHKIMEKLLDSKEIDACVTMHYNFPIGVSTVGKVITPGKGKEMFIATTTGTSSTNRIEGMVKNTIYGIIAAKACGIKNPTVGILNVDGAKAVERVLTELKGNGYDISFTESLRSDGGTIMRGNDLLGGACDVMVCDSLTGNILMKMFSSYTTGGSYEASGYGYGPGISENYDRNILILSRASGAPVVAGAIEYAASLAKGKIYEVNQREFESANKASLKDILSKLTKEKKKDSSDEVIAPPKCIVTGQISGIEIMDLEDAVKALWKAGVYAESGMGCTGAIVMVSEDKIEESLVILSQAGFISQEKTNC